jgi:psiF repeat
MRARVGLAMMAMAGLLACSTAQSAEPPAHPSATPVKHNSLKVCNQQADSKKLSGAARTQFVKHCQSQTVSSHGPAVPAASAASQATR